MYGRLFWAISLLCFFDSTFASTSAKYVIMINGDGMAQAHIDAGACYVNNGSADLNFESFPEQNLQTHNNAGGGTTDSAASATAWATGQKVNNGVISVQLPGDSSALTTVLEIHKDGARRTGIVSTAFISDASPAAFAAHETSRNNTSDIWNDYITQSQPNVIFGGGGNGFNQTNTQGAGYSVVTTRAAFNSLDPNAATFYAGVFGSGEIAAVDVTGRGDYPTLPEMTATALEILDNDPDGFFLFIEHEGTDTYSHANNIDGLVKSVAELEDAVQEVIDWVNDGANDSDWNNTLVVITGDHETGGLTLNSCSGIGNTPNVSWGSGGHTQTPVPIYARGEGAAQIQGSGGNIDNTDVFDILRPPGAPQSCTTVDLNATEDTYLRGGTNAGTNYGGSTPLRVDGDPANDESSTLIKWDVSSIPAGATINSASIGLDVTNASANSYQVYQLLRDWNGSQANWNQYSSGNNWENAGARGTNDRGSSSSGRRRVRVPPISSRPSA